MSSLLRDPITNDIRTDLANKMVFLGGPRQVGKTTLAQMLPGDYRDGHPGYYNWDNPEHRQHILRRAWPYQQLFRLLHKRFAVVNFDYK